MHLEHVAGGARKRRHDRHVPPGEPVDQARLARVRRSEDRDRQAGAQLLAPMTVRQMRRHFGRQPRDLRPDAREQVLGQVLFGGEVDLGLEPGERPEQDLPPRPVEPPQSAVQLLQGLARLSAGLGIDQVGQALDRGQIEPAVQERAAGELAGLGRPQTRQIRQRRPGSRR